MELFVGLTAGLLGSVVGGFITWITTSQRLDKELQHRYDQELTRDRLTVYRELWTLTEIAPRHYAVDGEPSATDLLQVREELHNWFFNKGGLFLSQLGRDRYFDVQDALTDAARLARTQVERPSETDLEQLKKAGEDLRIQLAHDVGTAEQPSLHRQRLTRPQSPQSPHARDGARESSAPSGLTLHVAAYLWEEYRYRHDLVWRLLFRVTSIAVLLLFVPFLADDSVRRVAGNWLLVPPAIAIGVVGIGIVELGLEMRLFERVKDSYREVQDVVLMDVKAWLPHSLKQSARTEKSIDFRFSWLVRLYLWLLLLASVLTFVFVLTQLSEIRSEFGG